MKRLLYLLVFLLITNLSAFSADMRFIQVDGALYSIDNAKKFESLINKINNEKMSLLSSLLVIIFLNQEKKSLKVL